MKKTFLLLLASLAMAVQVAGDELYGKIITLNTATSLEEDVWYVLSNSSSRAFLYDDGSGTLTTGSSPEGKFATSDLAGCFVKLVGAGDGTYYLQTGRGNYFGSLSTVAATLTTEAQETYSIETDEGGASPWYLSNSGLYLSSYVRGSSSKLYSTSWIVYAVTLRSEDELTAQERLSLQESHFASGEPCLARFFCCRDKTKYLTSAEKGTATGETLKSKTSYSQIWVVTCTGTGQYTFRNAETGEYLTKTYAEPGAETTLYMQESPNNGTNDYYYNISSSSSFGSSSCLHLATDLTSLHQGGPTDSNRGSDWAAEMVYEVTTDEVAEHLQDVSDYAFELTDGAYYHIVNVYYDKVITEADNLLKCVEEDRTDYSQCWQLISNGDTWQMRNVLTGNYIQEQSSSSTQYKTTTSPGDFVVTGEGEVLSDSWYIMNSSNTARVMRCNSSYQVVTGSSSNNKNVWKFSEVQLSDDDLADMEEQRQELEEYTDLLDNIDEIQAALDRLFVDKACTELRSGIASLTDEELDADEDYATLPTAIKRMVTKVKNDTWGLTAEDSETTDSYERFFRIADYSPYSHYSTMASADYTCMSYTYGKLSGPTGIFLSGGSLLYLYVDDEPSADCTLQVELVVIADTPGDHKTGDTTDLHAGLNVIRADQPAVVYIFYQLDNPEKYLADYPDIKVHIEGGTVNGYWDATRSMTNLDWANMRELGLLSQCSVLNLKTENLVFAMGSSLVLDAIATAHEKAGDETEDIEKLMRIWDMYCANERRYLGLEEFDGRLRNIWNAFTNTGSYMSATTSGTYYSEETIADIMDYYKLIHVEDASGDHPIWGPSHEMGHCHQKPIKLVGTTESSNNLFSNINLFEQGVCTTRYYSPAYNFDNYLSGLLPWNERPIEVTARMFFQLYLYFHVMEHDTEFLPKLFKALREDPIGSGRTSSTVTADTDGDGVPDVTGGTLYEGKTDYLHFAKKVCDIAEADLSEFFEAWGMFVPVENYYLYDYGDKFVTTTQDDIDEAREYMRQYEKKLGNIMFIDDHIEKKLADPDNKFEAIPAEDGYKVDGYSQYESKVGEAGDFGDYEQYDGHAEYDTDGDYYTVSGTAIRFQGTGCVGHKVYDLDGNLIWACNKKTATMPVSVRNLLPDNAVVVAAEENMSDVPCPYYRVNVSDVYKMQVSFPDGNDKQWWANDNIDAYLPANAIAVIGKSGAPESLTSSVNVVDTDGTAQTVVIDGDIPCYIQQPFTAASLSFTKSGDGWQALNLPFAVEGGLTISGDTTEIRTADIVEVGSPVVVEGDVAYSLSDVAVNAGDYTSAASAYVLSSDATAVAEAEDISPFVYQFNHAFVLGEYDSVNSLLSAPDADQNTVYDLSGSRLYRVTKPGIYIVNGVKTFIR